jgi:SM-20-related protein
MSRHEFGEAGLFIDDAFLTPSQVEALAACARRRRELGEFSAAGTGAGRSLQRQLSVRGDVTCWLSEPVTGEERGLLERLEALRLDLNSRHYLGLMELEVHYAWYAPGSGYQRHVDQPAGRSQRRVSLVLYLNAAWGEGDGGELRLFDAHQSPCEILPVGGRLVCFLSAGREHEVLPARRDRLSVTGWFRGRD